MPRQFCLRLVLVLEFHVSCLFVLFGLIAKAEEGFMLSLSCHAAFGKGDCQANGQKWNIFWR